MEQLYWIALLTVVGFGILLCLARREKVDTQTGSLLKPFYRMAMYLYKRMNGFFPGRFSSSQVEKDLLQLHPGESGGYLKTMYYVKKASICMAVIFAGTLFGAAAKFSAESGIVLQEGGIIVRDSYDKESREIGLALDYGEKQMDFKVEVEPLMLSGEEAETLLDEFVDRLPQYMAGKNESLQKVISDLSLAEKYDGFPVSVIWESNKPGLLSSDGQVFSVEEPEEVTLTAYVSYGTSSRVKEFQVMLVPPELSEEELAYRELEELLTQSQGESVRQEEWRLPEEWRGESIAWRQVVEDNSLLLWAAAIAASVMVFFFLDKDLHGQLVERQKRLHREYAEIVHKLVLYVGAGMTIRGTFQKLAGDYEAKCREGGKSSPAYEEILYTCRELHSGVSEGLAYEHFGRRAGLQEYIRLSTLLTQNLKRGNSTLLERLREEAEKSAEERLQQSKKLGEEAGTKLLVPMVLMLAVVMAVIMIPAMANM
ncbi:MAG TPA: hypothetical protein DCZ91_21600 [Lachnospiraceae bacterium]|nr:hypothetical protein [Lachnospiraceae bacterium]